MSRINPLYRLMAAGLMALAVLVLLLPGTPGVVGEEPSLHIYCAAALRKPIEAIAQRYGSEHGVRINIQYGGSNTLLSQIEAARVGDLFLAADDVYLSTASERGLAGNATPVARMTAVVVSSPERAGQIRSIADLAKLRLSIGSPDQAAIGRATRAALQAAGNWELIDDAVRRSGVYKPTVGDVANDVALGAAEAGIVWDAVASQHPALSVVRLPELSSAQGAVGVAVLTGSHHPEHARDFARYLSHNEKSRHEFAKWGFEPAGASDH
ncbi:putative binding protein precursor [Posidoniimonas corsicana]|uniref:Putative binding protein n=1 Tax=Posidoniimonas corsicana TaxID=1938618 RepID=A0A5C5VIR8_9BACT|nr:molybdate ABC transporter substrate-binding protein [Posidoniimonas corsicana]TWT37857.1 putative binding protein precursor [Posidoniimonas corsicana]